MPIAKIIHQIDAYLSSLLQARELLSAPIEKAPNESLPRQQRKIKSRKMAAAAPTKARVLKPKSRSAAQSAERSAMKERSRIHPPSQVRNSLTAPVAEPDQPRPVEDAKPVPASTIQPQQIIRTERPSTLKSANAARPARRSIPKPPVRPKLEAAKPAIALAGSMNSRIVVVSAEQARQERNRTAPTPPEVRRPRVPSTGLNGKLAFEALFKDSSDPSTSSGQ